MWPSVWQLWQLIQPSCDNLRTVKEPLAPVGGGRLGPRPQADRRGSLAGRRRDDRDRVVQAVGDVEEFPVRAGRHGGGRRPTTIRRGPWPTPAEMATSSAPGNATIMLPRPSMAIAPGSPAA